VNRSPVKFSTRTLRVSFISRYSGLVFASTRHRVYYTKKLIPYCAGMDISPAYCRTTFTPPGKQIQRPTVVRLPTIRPSILKKRWWHTFLIPLQRTYATIVTSCTTIRLGPAPMFFYLSRVSSEEARPWLYTSNSSVTCNARNQGRIASGRSRRLGERAAVRYRPDTHFCGLPGFNWQKHYRAGYGGDVVRA